MIFLGWHTFEKGDGEKLRSYVEQGGTLILSRRHLSTSLIHNGKAEYTSDAALDELLGQNWQQAQGIVRRTCGKGKVIFFASDCFPAEEEIRKEYLEVMAESAEAVCREEYDFCYARGNEDVNFCVRELEDGSRQLFLLNIRWWDKADSKVTVYRRGIPEEIVVPQGEIIIR